MISLVDLIKKVLQLYFNNFKIILPLLLVSLFWNIALAAIPASFATTIKFLLPATIISFIISAFTELALINGFSVLIQNTKVATKTLLAQALIKLPRFIVIFILWSIIMLIGATFLIIPAIIFAVWFMFAGTIFMLEDKTGIWGIFQRSKYLASGNFFALLLRAAVIIILSISIMPMSKQGLTNIINLLPLVSASSYIPVITGIFGVVLSILLLPIITGAIVVLYYEIKKIKE